MIMQKKDNELIISHDMHKRKDEATTKLFQKRDVIPCELQNLPIESFKKLLVSALIAFVYILLFDT